MDATALAFMQFLGAALCEADALGLPSLELAAYVRLLRWYGAQGRPLPGALDAVHRIALAATVEEQRAVALVLGEFFQPAGERTHGGDTVRVWRHARADAAMAAARAEVARVARLSLHRSKAAQNRWDKQRARAAQPDLPGLAPAGEASLPAAVAADPPAAPVDKYAIAYAKPMQLHMQLHPFCMRIKSNRIFNTTQSAVQTTPAADPAPPLRQHGIETPAARLAAILIAQGVNVSAGHATVRHWIEAGVDEEDLAAAVRRARRCVGTQQPISARYLALTLRSIMVERQRAARGPP